MAYRKIPIRLNKKNEDLDLNFYNSYDKPHDYINLQKYEYSEENIFIDVLKK